jgi:hypothetical protein
MKPVGQFEDFQGDVTTLNWLGPRPPASLAQNLGFNPARLAAGYWMVLLYSPLNVGDFEFSGTTLRSGGRLGLPAATGAADKLRPRVHDQIMAERGADGYKKLQAQVLSSVTITGPNRIAKVIPETRHDASAAPNIQYPMGGGGLQWTLIKKKRFLIALHVGPDGMATTPRFAVSLAETQPFQQLYDNRFKIAQYLASA